LDRETITHSIVVSPCLRNCRKYHRVNYLILLPLLAALSVLEVFIGGARLIYCVPAICLIGVAAALSWIPGIKPSGRAYLPAIAATCAFTIYILIRNRLSDVEYIARMQFFILAGCFLVYLLVGVVLTRPVDRRLVVAFLLILAVVQLVPAIVQFSGEKGWMPLPWAQRLPGFDNWRASGFFICPNHFAGFMEIASLLAMSHTIWGRGSVRMKILAGYVTLACLAGVGISGSRGGYVSLAVGICVLVILSVMALPRLQQRNLLIGIILTATLIIAIAGGVFFLIQNQALFQRLTEVNDQANPRLLLWHAALDQFHLSPIWGTGGFSYLYYGRLFRDLSIQGDPIHVHNDYLQLLADYGTVGLGLFLIMLLLHLYSGLGAFRGLLRRAHQSGNPPGDRLALIIGSLAVLAAYIVHSAMDFNMQIPQNALVIAFVFGVLANPGGSNEERSMERHPWFRVLLRWSLPLLGVGILIYGIPRIAGEYYCERARVALRDGHPKESLKIAQKGLQKTHDNPELYFAAGNAAMHLAQESGSKNKGADRVSAPELIHEALAMFRDGLRVFPNDARLALKLAMAQALSGDYYGALDSAEYAKTLDPNSSFVAAYRGFIEYTFHYYDDADSYFREAIELGGEGADIAQHGMEFSAKARQAPEAANAINSTWWGP